MNYKLSYRTLHSYADSETGITLPVDLRLGGVTVKVLDAKLDTGATHCIFKRAIGEALGLEIEKGDAKRFGTALGQFTAYGHWVNLSALEFSFDTEVFFADVGRNVLGRQGWLDKLRLGIVDYDQKLYASMYDDPEE